MLFDVGCYIYDFIWTFGLSSVELIIQNKISFANGQAKFIALKSDKKANNILSFKFGYGKAYSNVVKIISKHINCNVIHR
jgi:hypothetical protein